MIDVKNRYDALNAMFAGATTPGERVAARNALAKHVEKHGDPPYARQANEAGQRFESAVRWCRWRPLDPISPEIGRCIAPDGRRVMMSCGTARQAHKCVVCDLPIPKGGRCWRAFLYNGNYRGHRICCDCYMPDPKATTGAGG